MLYLGFAFILDTSFLWRPQSCLLRKGSQSFFDEECRLLKSPWWSWRKKSFITATNKLWEGQSENRISTQLIRLKSTSYFATTKANSKMITNWHVSLMLQKAWRFHPHQRISFIMRHLAMVFTARKGFEGSFSSLYRAYTEHLPLCTGHICTRSCSCYSSQCCLDASMPRFCCIFPKKAALGSLWREKNMVFQFCN